MFGKLFLKTDSNGVYVNDVYCQKHFGAEAGIGVNTIPNQNQINCEHTWPQSKFSGLYSKDIQKADLHHLFPADSKANSIRGNQDFTEVNNDTGDLARGKCSVSKFGSSATSSNDGFEPPLTHKGNVARALFYFSVRYKISIPKSEEDVLRRWHELDPVDQEELDRNDAIYTAQSNRNPFIDYPQLVNYISKF
jgi:endonuclease I